MDKTLVVLAGMLVGLGFSANLSAQMLSSSSLPASDSVVSLVADEAGLPLVPPSQLPPFGGTYWLVSPGAGGCLAAPLPCPPVDLTMRIYALTPDGQQFLVDATAGQALSRSPSAGRLTTTAAVVSAVEAQATSVANFIAQIQATQSQSQSSLMAAGIEPPGAGGGEDGGYTPLGNSPMPIDLSHLWLQIIAVTNKTASLVIHPPTNDVASASQVWELLYATNLLIPPTNWQWVLRSYPQDTNLIVRNAKDTQGFYRLRQTDDSVANDSLGTNFWLMFPAMEEEYGGGQLVIFISSPVGATGTVSTPGMVGNGPVLIITNCGDQAVNGRYLLTNLTVQEQTDLGVQTTYLFRTNYVILVGTTWELVTYDDVTRSPNALYEKQGFNLNGSTNDWVVDGDPNPQTPRSICAQVPLASQTFTLPAGGMTNIVISVAAMMTNFDSVGTNGIHVAANRRVAVYGLSYEPWASAAFTAYPTTLLGTNYCLIARAANLGRFRSEFAIVGTASNTTINITPSPTANLQGRAGPYSLNLNEGETYIVQSQTESNDVTGTWIGSDKPVGVFAGADLAFVPDENSPVGNPLMQEQMSVDSWGKETLTMGFAGRSGGDSYRVLAIATNTVVFTNGVIAGTNQVGKFLDLIIDGPVDFQGSQPIQVAHFANGKGFDGGLGDPCEILLPPIGHCLMTNILAAPDGFDANGRPYDFWEHFLNLVVIQSAITNTFVDNLPVDATSFAPIGNSGYYGAQLPLTTTGKHRITSSQPVGVEIYGFGTEEAYGYSGGVSK